MENKKQTVHMVSLGCPKNRVDSEVMLGHLFGDGYTHVESAEGADLVIVNTCGFIDEAKEESIDTILEMEELKKSGQCKKLVVAGCLSQRYAPDLAKEMPDVDHFIGTGNFDSLPILLASRRPLSRMRPPVFYQSSMICPVFEARMLLSPTVTRKLSTVKRSIFQTPISRSVPIPHALRPNLATHPI